MPQSREAGMDESRQCTRKPRTDLGTIILHWALVGALIVATATGLAIAETVPGNDWPDAIASLLPLTQIWADHFRAGLAVIIIAVAYPVYISRASLIPRIKLDAIRIHDLGRHPYRWATVNVALHWICYFTLVTEIATGLLLYLNRGGATVLMLHWAGMWAIIGFLPAHLLFHVAFGGSQQLLRLFRPAPLPAQPPLPFDPSSLDKQERSPPTALP
jgi:cytochrome b561